MSRAGYDPHAVPVIWRQLIREDEADHDKGPHMYYFATHPTAKERMRTLDRLADGIHAAKSDRGVDRYRAMILPRRLDWIRDELALRRFDRLEALLDMMIEDGANLGELHFAKGELYRLRNKDGDSDKALGALREAIASNGAPPEALRSLGLVLLRRGERAEARAAFADYLARDPAAGDRPMIEALIAEAG
jgi:predicted Zn-dependent protease